MWGATMLPFAALGAVAAPKPAVAYAVGCSMAETHFAASRKALQAAIDDYAACVARSHGEDDCAAAFRKLRASQSDVATAVADFKGSCPPE
jgi:hypothetical protein